MATSGSRTAALSLMRRMLRVSRGWRGEGGADEARYIVQETSRMFRERRHLRDADVIAGALDEGEGRLQTALHYGIAYPRMTHTPLAGGGDVKNVLPPAEVGGSLGVARRGGVRERCRSAHRGVQRPGEPGEERGQGGGARQETRDDERHRRGDRRGKGGERR